MSEETKGTQHQTKEPGKSDFYFLNTVKEGGMVSPLVRKLEVISKRPVSIGEALGAVVGIFLQSFLDIRPELERENTSRSEEPWCRPMIPESTKTNP